MSPFLPPANDDLPSAVECAWLPLPMPSRDELGLLRAAGATEFSLRDMRCFSVQFVRGGFFEFAKIPGDGERAFIMPIRSAWEEIIDISAWLPHAPLTVSLMTGAAAMLGEGRLGNPASFAGGRPLSVFRSVSTWLARDLRGIVLIDPARAALRLADAPALLAEDADHARELGRLLAPHVPADRILLPRSAVRAA